MQRNTNSYDIQRIKAEKIFTEAQQDWVDFSHSIYHIPQQSNVKKAIDSLNTIPKEMQTDADQAALLKYYLAAGYVKVNNKHLREDDFKSVLPYRQKAVEIQQKILEKKKTREEENHLAETLSWLAIAYSNQSSPSQQDMLQAKTTIEKAISVTQNTVEKSVNDLTQLAYYHEEAMRIGGKFYDFAFATSHYLSCVEALEEIIKKSDRAFMETHKEKIEDIKHEFKMLFKHNTPRVMETTINLVKKQEALELKLQQLEKENVALKKQIENTANDNEKNHSALTHFSALRRNRSFSL